MAQTAGSVIVEVGANTSNFDRAMARLHMGFGRLERSSGRANRSLGAFTRGAASATLAAIGLRGAVLASTGAFLSGAGLVMAMGKSIGVAISLEEQINKVGVVFGRSSRGIINWSKSTATGIGLAQVSALEAAGTFGNMLRPLGIIPKQAAVMSKALVNLAGDMSSFNNASLEDTLLAIRAGLAGEVEPLRRFGVFLSETRLKAQAIKSGFVGPGFKGVLDPLVKSLSAYNLILKDTKLAQGDYNRTQNSTANIIRTVKAQVTDLAGALGEGLEPVVNRVGRELRDKLADPETRAKIAAVGRVLGDKLYVALQKIGTWFDQNWGGIESGFRTAGTALEGAATAAQRLHGWLQKINEMTPSDESLITTIIGGALAYKGLKAVARSSVGRGAARAAGMTPVGRVVTAGIAVAAAGVGQERLNVVNQRNAWNKLTAKQQWAIYESNPAKVTTYLAMIDARMKPYPTAGGDREDRSASAKREAAVNARVKKKEATLKPITSDKPLQDTPGDKTKKASSKVQQLLPAGLRLALAEAEVTQGTRDDLKAWRAIERWLEQRIRVTRNVNKRIEMLEALAGARNAIAGLNPETGAKERTRITSLFSGPFMTGEAFGIASSFGYKAQPRDLLRDLRGQNAQLTTLVRSVTRLRKRGAPGSLISDLLAGGVENADEAATLAGASPKILKQYFNALKNRERLEERVQTMVVSSQSVTVNAGSVVVNGGGAGGGHDGKTKKKARTVGARRGGR